MFKLTKSNVVIRLEDMAFIPTDESNSDYKQYLEWCAAGNIPQQVDIDESVLESTSLT